MAMNKSKGNMYEFVTHTWNTVKGECPHNCIYCYMKSIARRFNKPQRAPHFDDRELKTNLGEGNFIFVGSSNDLFAKDIPAEWIQKTLEHCGKFNNRYLFQTKNPERILDFTEYEIIRKSVVCTTLECDVFYPEFMGNTPHPMERSIAMQRLNEKGIQTYVTVEPIIDFLLEHFVTAIIRCNPTQVNIGADSGHNHLPEPPKDKIMQLISELEKFTTVKLKSNINRLL